MKPKTILFFILVIIISCEQSSKDKHKIVTRYGNNIKGEISYLYDTIMDGPARFYKDGKLSLEMNYKNNLKQGWSRSYDSAGKLESEFWFNNDLREKTGFHYYNNGNLKAKINFLNDKNFGDALYYYSNGRLETFNSFDFEGCCTYLIKCDSSGRKLIEQGYILGQLFYIGNFDSIPQNTNTTFKVSFAKPPNTIVRAFVGERKKKNYPIEYIELNVSNNPLLIERTFTLLGRHTIVTKGEMRDLNGKLLKVDSIITNIFVVPTI